MDFDCIIFLFGSLAIKIFVNVLRQSKIEIGRRKFYSRQLPVEMLTEFHRNLHERKLDFQENLLILRKDFDAIARQISLPHTGNLFPLELLRSEHFMADCLCRSRINRHHTNSCCLTVIFNLTEMIYSSIVFIHGNVILTLSSGRKYSFGPSTYWLRKLFAFNWLFGYFRLPSSIQLKSIFGEKRNPLITKNRFRAFFLLVLWLDLGYLNKTPISKCTFNSTIQIFHMFPWNFSLLSIE